MDVRLAELPDEGMKKHGALCGEHKVKAAVPVAGQLLGPLGRLLAEISTAVVLDFVAEDDRAIRQILPTADVLDGNDTVLLRLKAIYRSAIFRATLIQRIVKEIPQLIGGFAITW
jgi:hypothetical protein